MTAPTSEAPPETRPGPGRGLRASRRARLSDPTFRAFVAGCGLLVLVILAWMIIATTRDALPVFEKEGILGFFFGTDWEPGNARDGTITGEYGALEFLAGTVYVSLMAMLIAVPAAIGIALYLTELAPRRIRQPLTYMVDLLAAVPSVVYGLVGAKILAGIMLPFWNAINDNLAFLPFLGGNVRVNNLSLGALVLAIMILPIISAVTREVFSQVPIDERYAAFGLGATRWEVMRHVVIHRSRAGIIGGSMLGLGRALGETIAVLLVLGANARLLFEPFNTSQTVAAQIAAAFKEASPEYIRALVALGVALFVVTLIVNVISRLIVSRFGNVTGDASI